MEDSTRNDNRTAAEELARMLETTPSPLSSLKLDHATLVAKLAALMPFIEAFALCTTDLLERGNQEDARQGLEAFSVKFAGALNISTADSHTFCMCLLMLRLAIKYMHPFFQSMTEKKTWEEWFQRLWGKED
jgi:hypothetical protein